eukprot:10366791-Alexandrium_andersonii.AAC.1
MEGDDPRRRRLRPSLRLRPSPRWGRSSSDALEDGVRPAHIRRLCGRAGSCASLPAPPPRAPPPPGGGSGAR